MPMRTRVCWGASRSSRVSSAISRRRMPMCSVTNPRWSALATCSSGSRNSAQRCRTRSIAGTRNIQSSRPNWERCAGEPTRQACAPSDSRPKQESWSIAAPRQRRRSAAHARAWRKRRRHWRGSMSAGRCSKGNATNCAMRSQPRAAVRKPTRQGRVRWPFNWNRAARRRARCWPPSSACGRSSRSSLRGVRSSRARSMRARRRSPSSSARSSRRWRDASRIDGGRRCGPQDPG
jgi:hypothetical protein